MARAGCSECARHLVALEALEMRVVQLQTENEVLQCELDETLKLVELQQADIERYEKAFKEHRPPNCPERAPDDKLQLAMQRVLEAHGDGLDLDLGDADDDDADADEASSEEASAGRTPKDKRRRRHKHGRRALDMTNLPVKQVVIDPPEVLETGGESFRQIGDERSSRLAYQPASYVRLEIIRTKWVRAEDLPAVHAVDELAGLVEQQLPPVLIAPVPDCLWPRFMADTSVIANIAVSKYADLLPLNRQQTISTRRDFTIPRSTQCNWLGQAYKYAYRVVDAMMADACRGASVIATDATGAPVKGMSGTDGWHVFVFIADNGHIVFRHSEAHTNQAVTEMLRGYRGVLLADGSSIYDALYTAAEGQEPLMTEAGCWAHMRRYVWKALPSDPDRACEGLAVIGRLFEVERAFLDTPMPDKTAERAAVAGPIVELFGRWVAGLEDRADPRGPLAAVATYFTNQEEALRRFLGDGRIAIHNNHSERQLRALVVGLNNWHYFANETGLKWYTTFRSLIASCLLHDLNPEEYLEQMLRLVPHWPVTHVLELAPKYWRRTVAGLDEQQRAIFTRPMELESRTVASLCAVSDAAE